MRVYVIVAILFNVIELLHRIRVFDYFAHFILQSNAILTTTMPLFITLLIVVLAQTLLFWILDQNHTTEFSYEGLDGFGNCFVNSYRLALGDFEIVESFLVDADHLNVIIFWLIFFLSTMASLLLILNMVIGIMSIRFEEIELEKEENILCAKLQLFVENHHCFPEFLKTKLKKDTYLLAIDVDPEEDPFEKETADKRINERITDVGKRLDLLSEDLVRVS